MASGYDISSRHPFRLMKGRLGIYDKHIYEPQKTDPEINGIIHQSKRLVAHGGNTQQERMIKDKRRSLDHALWFSYQGVNIKKVNSKLQEPIRALINPNKLKQDYDDKILSVGFEYNFKCGDVFEWIGTNTHWLIYLQDLTELAYFRGDIRKCSYEIAWEDEEGMHSTYAALRGPVETRINYIQKHQVSVDIPNHSLNILMPHNEATLRYFKRYSKFYLQNETGMEKICWRVEAIDWLSTPGILEIAAVEYYANTIEDDIDNGIVGGLVVTKPNPNDEETEATIIGETFIKPKKTYEYYFNGAAYQDWIIDKNYPVEIVIDELEPRRISLKWDSSYCGQFELNYGTYTKIIVVESLF